MKPPRGQTPCGQRPRLPGSMPYPQGLEHSRCSSNATQAASWILAGRKDVQKPERKSAGRLFSWVLLLYFFLATSSQRKAVGGSHAPDGECALGSYDCRGTERACGHGELATCRFQCQYQRRARATQPACFLLRANRGKEVGGE